MQILIQWNFNSIRLYEHVHSFYSFKFDGIFVLIHLISCSKCAFTFTYSNFGWVMLRARAEVHRDSFVIYVHMYKYNETAR